MEISCTDEKIRRSLDLAVLRDTVVTLEAFESFSYSITLTSSITSRTAASCNDSPGSTPPDGTIHLSLWRLLVTNRI